MKTGSNATRLKPRRVKENVLAFSDAQTAVGTLSPAATTTRDKNMQMTYFFAQVAGIAME